MTILQTPGLLWSLIADVKQKLGAFRLTLSHAFFYITPMNATADRFFLKAGIWIAGFTLLRFFYAGFCQLVPDEAYYWQWSQHLALGYYDHPPMIAWLIWLTTAVLGQNEFAVRLPSLGAMAAASLYMAAMAKRWIGARCAWQTALLTQAVVLFNIGGILATPDGLQALGWAGASYHAARGYEQGRWSQWLLTGFWFGFGMLSKYSMALFPLCILLYGLFSPQHRARFKTLPIYAGALLGILMLAPVVFWNYAHNFETFRHAAYMGGANEGFSLRLRFLGDYAGSQAALLTPLVFVLVVFAWVLFLRERRQGEQPWIYAYLFFTSFPVFFLFLSLSLKSRVYGNWPGAGYLTAAVLVAACFGGRSFFPDNFCLIQWGRRVFPWAVITAYGLSAILFLHILFPFLPVPAKMDRAVAETTGWQILGRTVGEWVQTMPRLDQTFVFGLDYQTASEAAFYMPGNAPAVAINRWNRPNAYDFWYKDKDLQGYDAIGITNNATISGRMQDTFLRVEPAFKLKIYRKSWFSGPQDESQKIRSFYLYRCFGFKGGLRWRPKETGDIRSGKGAAR